jgi:succinyl-diaminopimelate desuccinylase
VGHLDTVRCAEGQPTEIRDGRVYGCGASDMKSGVAVMLALLDRWRELRAARPVWIFYDREEGPHEENGLGPVLESGVLPELELAFVLEPTDLALQMGCMGTLHATVTVRGQRAHSARPWQGENAIYRALPLLQRLRDRERRPVRYGDLTYYEVVVATEALTRNSRNVVPDALLLNVNFRFAPGNTAEAAERELRELVGADGEVEVTDRAPAGAVYLDHPLLEPWRRREGIEVQTKQAWTDVARFTERGIPAVNYGPGETAQAHQAGEWCSVDSLERVYGALWSYFAGAELSAIS